MLSVILVMRGTSITFLTPSSSFSLGANSLRYSSFNLAMSSHPTICLFSTSPTSGNHVTGRFVNSHFLAVFDLEAHPVSLLGLRVENGQVGNLNRHFLLNDTAWNTQLRIGTLVLFNYIDAA